MIVTLLADMYRNPEILKRLQTDPQKIFKEYGLSPEDEVVLRSSDMFLIAERGADDVRKILISQARPDINIFFWSGPPHPQSITPSSAQTGDEIKVTVTGTNFAQSASLDFQLEQATLDVHTKNVQVSADGMSLKATVRFNSNQKGVFDVVVKNPNGLSGSLTAAFTVS